MVGALNSTTRISLSSLPSSSSSPSLTNACSLIGSLEESKNESFHEFIFHRIGPEFSFSLNIEIPPKVPIFFVVSSPVSTSGPRTLEGRFCGSSAELTVEIGRQTGRESSDQPIGSWGETEMVGGGRQSVPSWVSAAAATRVDFEGNMNTASSTSSSTASSSSDNMLRGGNHPQQPLQKYRLPDVDLGFGERALSAAGAAVLSAVIVNPLDVAKTRLQAQAAGVPYSGLCCMSSLDSSTILPDLRSNALRTRAVVGAECVCPPGCDQYKGTLDVFYKVIRQEGYTRLWRGTNASLALAIPTVGIYLPCYDIFRDLMEDFTARNSPIMTPYVPLIAGSIARSLACISCYPVELARTRMQAFKEMKDGPKPPGVWKTLLDVTKPVKSINGHNNFLHYRILWTGLGAQLARDVPFSAICWSTLEPIRRNLFGLFGDEASAASIVGVNFSAGFVAGMLAAAATCPLDVAKTRRQIEKDPARALSMTTRQTLAEIWRDGGVKGLFAGLGPRVSRAGPSVGIVVSFYEVVKYALHHRHATDGGRG